MSLPVDRRALVREALQKSVPGLRALAQARLRNDEDVDDALQQTSLRVLERIDQFRAGGPAEHWIFIILRNIIRTQFRASKLKPVSRPPALPMLPPEDALERQEDLNRLSWAIARLEPEFRAPFLLCRVYDVPQHDIAELLGISVDFVRVRIHRAIEKLRTAVKEPS